MFYPGDIRTPGTARPAAGRAVWPVVAVTLLMTFVAAGLWLTWTLAELALGSLAGSLAVLALLAGTFAVSWRTCRAFTR